MFVLYFLVAKCIERSFTVMSVDGGGPKSSVGYGIWLMITDGLC